MKNTILLTLLIVICCFGCSRNEDDPFSFCDVTNPTQELTWLKTEIENRNNNPTQDMKYCYIAWAKFKGQDIIFYGDCNPLVNKVIPFYNCKGELLNQTELGINISTIDQIKNIWTPSNFVCENPMIS